MPVTINGTTGIVSPNYTGNGSVPVGSVYHFATSATPTGFLICNGNTVPNGSGTVQGVTTDFSALYTILGTTYGAAGTLPDLRGYFIRGNGTNSDGTASDVFGVKQNDAFKTHTHTTSVGVGTVGTGQGLMVANVSATDAARVAVLAEGSTETRPKNIALLPCIKY